MSGFDQMFMRVATGILMAIIFLFLMSVFDPASEEPEPALTVPPDTVYLYVQPDSITCATWRVFQ